MKPTHTANSCQYFFPTEFLKSHGLLSNVYKATALPSLLSREGASLIPKYSDVF